MGTDLDEFITSDTTEQQIVEFVEQLCSAIGQLSPSLEGSCKALVESQLPAIIDGLVNNNLNPQEVCTAIAACNLEDDEFVITFRFLINCTFKSCPCNHF